MDATAVAEITDALTDLVNDVHGMSIALFIAAIALVVIACRIPRSSEQVVREEQVSRRRAHSFAGQLARSVGGLVELTDTNGAALFGGFDTSRVRVLDCDDRWVLVASTNPKKPGQAVVRIDQIGGVCELAEDSAA